jgi:hypothetical protein
MPKFLYHIYNGEIFSILKIRAILLPQNGKKNTQSKYKLWWRYTFAEGLKTTISLYYRLKPACEKRLAKYFIYLV